MDISTQTVVVQSAASIPAYLAFAHQYLPPDLWNKIIVFLGYLSIVTQIAPWIVKIATPAALRAADWGVAWALASPFRPLILWKHEAIIKFLKDLKAALEQLLDTFVGEIETDLQKAEADAAMPPADKPAQASAGSNGPANQA